MISMGVLGSLGIAILLASGAIGHLSSSRADQDLRTEAGATSVVGASSACAGVLAEWNVNSTLFLEVCSEPAFQTAYDLRGVGAFTTGGIGGPGWEDDVYGFGWTAACRNATWAGQQCQEQEYWVANLTSNSVSGPFFEEGPGSCSGCPSGSILTTPAGLLFIGAGSAAVIVTLLVLRRRRLARAPTGPVPSRPRTPEGPPE